MNVHARFAGRTVAMVLAVSGVLLAAGLVNVRAACPYHKCFYATCIKHYSTPRIYEPKCGAGGDKAVFVGDSTQNFGDKVTPPSPPSVKWWHFQSSLGDTGCSPVCASSADIVEFGDAAIPTRAENGMHSCGSCAAATP
jgi:hypothetical protein